MLCYVMLCYVMLCYVMLCYVMLCYVMLCYVMLCYVMLCYVMLCYVMLCYVMLCYVMLCYVMLCYVMLCYVMLCYVMLCYVMCHMSHIISYIILHTILYYARQCNNSLLDVITTCQGWSHWLGLGHQDQTGIQGIQVEMYGNLKFLSQCFTCDAAMLFQETALLLRIKISVWHGLCR